MINTIRQIVDRIVSDSRLSALENKILNKYDELISPKKTTKCNTGCGDSPEVVEDTV